MLRHDKPDYRKHNRMLRAGGFTLLEMLLAVVVIAVVGTTLSTAIGGVTAQTYSLERRSIAHWIAQNQLVQMRLTQRASGEAMREGKDTTQVYMANREWDVRTTVSATDHPLMRRVQIEVFQIEDDERRGPYEQLSAFVGRF